MWQVPDAAIEGRLAVSVGRISSQSTRRDPNGSVRVPAPNLGDLSWIYDED